MYSAYNYRSLRILLQTCAVACRTVARRRAPRSQVVTKSCGVVITVVQGYSIYYLFVLCNFCFLNVTRSAGLRNGFGAVDQPCG
jgi:hypothetical protein